MKTQQQNLSLWLQSLAVTATPGMDECIEKLGGHIDWLLRFKQTPQDPEWHGEGNVHIHTDMVLEQLYLLLASEANHIQGWRRQALILGAVLHDIGKPVRTRTIEIQGIERVASPKHESVGRSYLAFKLMGLDLPFKVIWTVLNLVGEHHMPKLLAVQNKSQRHYWQLSRQADIELLYWLEVADMRGRICPDLQKQLLYLDEYRMFAEEYGVWEHAFDVRQQLAPHLDSLDKSVQDYVYASALYQLEQGHITMAEEALATTYQHRNQYSHLVVMCAPSGSGKTTWIENNCPDYDVVSLDNLREEINGDRASQKNKGRILQTAKERLKAALRHKHNVVWDATNVREDFRTVIAGLGRDYHALITMVVLLQAEEALFRNNRKRVHSVPDSVLLDQLESYQLPVLSEAHQVLLVGGGGNLLYRAGCM